LQGQPFGGRAVPDSVYAPKGRWRPFHRFRRLTKKVECEIRRKKQKKN